MLSHLFISSSQDLKSIMAGRLDLMRSDRGLMSCGYRPWDQNCRRTLLTQLTDRFFGRNSPSHGIFSCKRRSLQPSIWKRKVTDGWRLSCYTVVDGEPATAWPDEWRAGSQGKVIDGWSSSFHYLVDQRLTFPFFTGELLKGNDLPACLAVDQHSFLTASAGTQSRVLWFHLQDSPHNYFFLFF